MRFSFLLFALFAVLTSAAIAGTLEFAFMVFAWKPVTMPRSLIAHNIPSSSLYRLHPFPTNTMAIPSP